MFGAEWWWAVALAPVAAAVVRQFLVVLLTLVALYSRDEDRRKRAERLLGRLPALLPWQRNDNDPSQFGQGGSP